MVTQSEIDAAADAEGIDRHLFRGLIKQESGGKITARSGAGALGPGQLMPDTAKGLGVNPEDPIQNLRGSARYLRQQLDRFKGNPRLAAAAYNAGPGAVEKYGGVPPFAETQQYVRNVVGDGTMSDEGRKAAARAPAAQQPEVAPAAAVDTGQAKLAALQALKQHDVVGFATGIRNVKDQELAAQATAGATPAPAATHNDTASSSAPGIGGTAVDFARARIGHYKENAGANRGDELDTLQQRFGLTGEQWCAMFATTAAAHGGASRAVRTPSVAAINQWATAGVNGYEKGLKSDRDARAGDLLTLGDNHVAVVESIDEKGVHTIEGNTSGPGVTKGFRPFGSGKVARPKYRAAG